MSVFYSTMAPNIRADFKKRKQKFKKGKPCADCGKMYPKERMTVDHIIQAANISFHNALYDTSNWQVLCLSCHRKKCQLDQTQDDCPKST